MDTHLRLLQAEQLRYFLNRSFNGLPEAIEIKLLQAIYLSLKELATYSRIKTIIELYFYL